MSTIPHKDELIEHLKAYWDKYKGEINLYS